MKNERDRVAISILLQTYGGLLTDRQREMTVMYYDCDVSFGEIGVQYGVSRQAVRDAVMKTEKILVVAEHKIGMIELKREINRLAIEIGEKAKKIAELTEI
ncbi:MAG: sigma factor-like helix-turn-helix DNA-binding protein [Clostridia bacterium]